MDGYLLGVVSVKDMTSVLFQSPGGVPGFQARLHLLLAAAVWGQHSLCVSPSDDSSGWVPSARAGDKVGVLG